MYISENDSYGLTTLRSKHLTVEDDKNDRKLLDENIQKALIRVAEKLVNSPAVARDSNIYLKVITDHVEGKSEIDKLLNSTESLSIE